MSEKKNKEYTHMQVLETQILAMKEEGKTNREISEYFGLRDKYVVKQFISRCHRKQKMIEAGILPRRRGRSPKGYQPTEQEKDNEIKRLKMENELLRDFLRIAGRK
jgi:hypothetical protein